MLRHSSGIQLFMHLKRKKRKNKVNKTSKVKKIIIPDFNH